MLKPGPDFRVVQAAEPLLSYEPLILSGAQHMAGYWPQAAALLQPVVDGAMHGEMTIDDIYQAVADGRMYCIVFKDDTAGEVPAVALALVLELVAYPRKTMMGIVAVGGQELGLFQSRFWKHICSWAYMNGVREMQAMVSPAMARVIGRYGFAQVYNVMRLPITEM